MYNTRNNEVIADRFKDTFCHPCKPYFIGVWDTVASLGYFFGRRFFDATLHRDTPYGYHAISIDEQRKKFLPSIWDEDRVADGQRVEQVWFPGVHCDVGGSYPEAGLSDGALMWMLRHADNAGLRLKPGWEARYTPSPSDRDAHAPVADERVEALAESTPRDSGGIADPCECDREDGIGRRLQSPEPADASCRHRLGHGSDGGLGE